MRKFLFVVMALSMFVISQNQVQAQSVYCTFDYGGGGCAFTNNLCTDSYCFGCNYHYQSIVESSVTNIAVDLYYTECGSGAINFSLNGSLVYSIGSGAGCTCSPTQYPVTVNLCGSMLSPLTGGGGDYLEIQFTGNPAVSGVRTSVEVNGAGCPPDPCNSVITIANCGDSQYVSLDDGGIWDNSTTCWQSLGNEQLYQFTPATSGTYSINVSSYYSSAGDYTEWGFKAASGGCSNSGFSCIGNVSYTGQFGSFYMNAGTLYYIIVDRTDYWTGGTNDLTWDIVCPAAGPCDYITTIANCGDSHYVSLDDGGYWDYSAGCWQSLGNEQVYQYTAPISGTYYLNCSYYYSGTGDYTEFAYKDASGGCGNFGWNCLNNINYAASNFAAVSLNAGSTYYFLVDRTDYWTGGTNDLTWNLVCPPDPCNNIVTIANCGDSHYVSLDDGGSWDYSAGCWQSLGNEQVYQYTAPTTGTYYLNCSYYYSSTGIDYTEFAYKDASGGCGNYGWTCLNYINYAASNFAGVTLNAGTTYYFLVDRTDYWTGGTNDLTWNLVCPCAAVDPCSNILTANTCGSAQNLSLDGCSYWNLYDQYYGYYTNGDEQLYSYYAPTTGYYTITINNMSGQYDYVNYSFKPDYYGCDQYSYTEIQDFYGTGTTNQFYLNAGTTYYFLVDKTNVYGSGTTTFDWQINCPVDPCNSVQTLPDCGNYVYTYLTYNNSAWSGEGCGSYTNGGEQIYTYTPSVTGSYNLYDDTWGDDNMSWHYKDASLGCDMNNWNCIATDSWSTNAGTNIGSVTLNAGTTYYILIDRDYYWSGDVNTTWHLECPCAAVDPCTSIQTANTCGTTNYLSLDGCGYWTLYDQYYGYYTYGDEQLYSYYAPTTGNYTITVNNMSGTYDYINYSFKPDYYGCDQYSYTEIQDFYGTGTTNQFYLNAGTTYYFLVDKTNVYGGGTTTFDWQINCPPDPCNSIQTFPGCGITVSSYQPGNGAWTYESCGQYGGYEEIIYSFTPTVTGLYNLWDQTQYDDNRSWSYKDASLGCDQYNWNCIGTDDWSYTGIVGSVTLNAGTNYYILIDRECTWSCGGTPCNWYLECPAAAPTVTSFSPGNGCGGTVSVVISGTSFTYATAVDFGGTPAQSFVIDNDNQITAVPSPFGTTGVITVTNPTGSGSSSGTFTVNLPPQITFCPPDQSIDLPAGVCAMVVTYPDATAIGDAPVVITYSQNSGTSFAKGVTPVTVTATNSCGSATCTFMVYVNDVTSPTIAGCPADIVTDNSAGICGAYVSWADPTVTDDCPVTGGGTGSQTFTYTGSYQTFIVPSGVTSIDVDVDGGKGGYGSYGVSQGGSGGSVQGTISVTPGSTLEIYVGGAGTDGGAGFGGTGGFNGGGTGAFYPGNYGGGGGGGASDIRVSPYSLNDRMMVAAGGGGGAYNYGCTDCDRGGHGGTTTGEGGYSGGGLMAGGSGGGGTPSAGGIGGTYPGWCTAPNGAQGIGGDGGPCTNSGGGGGGGYYGGGGGTWSGGGGGSNYADPGATSVVHAQGVNTGNGSVTISWNSPSYPVITQIAGPTSGSIFPVGSTTITYQAFDGNNYVLCSFSVTVNDVELPVFISCPGDINVVTTGACDAQVFFADPTATDNCGSTSGSQIFSFTGSMETFVVPAGIFSVDIQAYGAQGGICYQPSYGTGNGGLGGHASGILSVTPGQTLNVFVGGTGSTSGPGGYNGGGSSLNSTYGSSGGGGSDVRVGGTALTDRVIVGGGGGGGSCGSCPIGGGDGGGLTGNAGLSSCGFTGAGGGTQSSGGAAGCCYGAAGPGSFGQGGGTDNDYHNAGGGGGYYGGGSGAGHASAGGGSSYIGGVTSGATVTGVQSGDGQIVITWVGSAITVVQTAGLPSGSIFPIGTTTNVFEATDPSGNIGICTFDVTVSEPVPPVISGIPSDIFVTSAGDNCNTPIFWTPPIVSDNCPGVIMTSNYNPGDVFPLGTTVVTYTATDASGNTDVQSFNVIVPDVQDNMGDVIVTVTGVTGSTWFDFYNGSNELIGRINPNGNNLGDVEMGVRNEPGPGPWVDQYGKNVLERWWYINPQFDGVYSTPVSVQFFIKDYEMNDLKANNGNIYGDNLDITKYDGQAEDQLDLGLQKPNPLGFVSLIPDASLTKIDYCAANAFLVMFDVNSFSTFSARQNGLGLPITLLSFDAIKQGNDVLVNWSTETEINNDYFEVEVATMSDEYGNLQFTKIAEVDGAGNYSGKLDYQIIDTEEGKQGVRYYRLKQVDFDGQFSYSDIKSVVFGEISISQVLVAPNPFSTNFDLLVNSAVSGNVEIEVYDITGKLVYSSNSFLNIGINEIELSLDKTIASGIYMLNATFNNEMHSIRIVKQD